MKKQRYIIVGSNPSTRPFGEIRKNSTFDRMHRWMDVIKVRHFSFMNCFDEPGEALIDKVDWDRFGCINTSYKVLALGGFVSRVLIKAGIDHIQLPHPSPRNRLFNDPTYEKEMLTWLKRELKNKR